VGVTLLAGCARQQDAGAPDVRREMAAAREAAGRWVASQQDGLPGDSVIIALGYLERHRMGLGSPFRLIETVLRDARLEETMRRSLASALLERTQARSGAQVDPLSLELLGLSRLGFLHGRGREYVSLIEEAVRDARSAEAGALGVRLAFLLLSAEGRISRESAANASRAALLARDRRLAAEDVQRLLRASEADGADPLVELVRWRAARAFTVESPNLASLSAPEENEAIELALRILPRLHAAALHAGDRRPDRGERSAEPLLKEAAAERLEQIARTAGHPPVAPIAVGRRMNATPAPDWPRTVVEEKTAEDALDEETFAARHARIPQILRYTSLPAQEVLWVAAAMRAYAQESVWVPGDPGPSAKEMQDRWGLAYVQFDPGIEAAIQPYFRSRLDGALRDMQRVFPLLDVRGMGVSFVPWGWNNVLAMHDPRRREIVLPLGSAGGTIAHELAHDLDWTIARKVYRVRGGYATDLAVREMRNLGMRVHSLSARGWGGSETAGQGAHASRPAENFARGYDWFAVSALAAQGISNGYLSSVQDAQITGYGSAHAPDLGGKSAEALVGILDDYSPPGAAARIAYLNAYGRARAWNPLDIAMAMLTPGASGTAAEENPMPGRGALEASLARTEEVRDRLMRQIAEGGCPAPRNVFGESTYEPRRRLVEALALALYRESAFYEARRVAGLNGLAWMEHRLYAGPWTLPDSDPELLPLLEDVYDRWARATERRYGESSAFRRKPFAAMCAETGPAATFFDLRP
jgi:hypothetical protein